MKTGGDGCAVQYNGAPSPFKMLILCNKSFQNMEMHYKRDIIEA